MIRATKKIWVGLHPLYIYIYTKNNQGPWNFIAHMGFMGFVALKTSPAPQETAQTPRLKIHWSWLIGTAPKASGHNLPQKASGVRMGEERKWFECMYIYCIIWNDMFLCNICIRILSIATTSLVFFWRIRPFKRKDKPVHKKGSGVI